MTTTSESIESIEARPRLSPSVTGAGGTGT